MVLRPLGKALDEEFVRTEVGVVSVDCSIVVVLSSRVFGDEEIMALSMSLNFCSF